MTFHGLVKRIVHRRPKAACLYHGDRTLSYGEVDEASDRAAWALAALGVGPGGRVGLFAPNSIEYVLAMLATWKLGAMTVHIDVRLAGDLAYYLGDGDPHVLIYSAGGRDAVCRNGSAAAALKARICLEGPDDGGETWEGLLARATPCHLPTVAEEAPAHLSYTSGSTGKPKGAVLAHEPTCRATSCIAERLGLRAADVTLGPTGLSSSYHLVANLLPGLQRGAAVGLMAQWDAREAWRIIAARSVSVFVANPLLLSDLLHTAPPGGPPPSLRMGISGGGPVPPDLKRDFSARLRVPLVESYGQSELGGFVALGRPEPPDPARLAAIGPILPDKEVIIGDGEDREVPIGEAGQILLRGGFMAGYWNRPEATAASLKGGWLHTGDVGKMDEDGNLYLLTRVSERIVSGGRAVYPRLLEEALLRHPAVHRVAVFGLPDQGLGQIAKAAVSLHPGATATEADLMAHCKKELGDRGPARLEILEGLPMTPTGKISKMDLLAREEA
jgi:acyl-CoA synthetase (AMP-forming)/AMP-acid ligase II